ncbi:MAG: tripartite tricarboxylate transporter TctB family protein [Chloroflexota bacterium]|nr:tripartite tricarboxylate transporter TctB family protein [Chloroflexota bacterium]
MNRTAKFWHKGEFYYIALLFIVTLLFVVESAGFPTKAKLFPLIVGGAALLVITADVLQMIFPALGEKFQGFKGGELFKTNREQQVVKELKARGEGDTADEEGTEAAGRSETMETVKTFLWFMGGFAVFYLFGYLAFSFLFIFLFLKFYARLSLIKSLAITGGFTLFVWAAFSLFLRLDILAGSSLF